LTDLPGFLYFINVNSLLRIITFILLLLALSTLTGMAQTASSLVSVEAPATTPCCPHEKGSDETPSALPDCNQDCHCSHCQGVDVSYRLLFLNPSVETQLHPTVTLTTFPLGHQKAIDYPPETA
jgi:hypothetical protein